MQENITYKLEQIGIIKTPYQEKAPYQPVETDEKEFQIIIHHQYVDGLNDLMKFHYIYLIYYANRIIKGVPHDY